MTKKGSESNPTFDLCISLSDENPFESRMIQILRNRLPVQVGRLRYAVGPALIRELLVRGAEELELEQPGSLGLQHLLGNYKACTAPAKETGAAPLLSQTEAECPRPSPPSETAGENATGLINGCSEPSRGIPSSEIPKLDLTGFDFGSSPAGVR